MRSEHPELARPAKRCLGALGTVSWPWIPVLGLLEPPRRGGENAQKTGIFGEKMGQIRSKRCEGVGITWGEMWRGVCTSWSTSTRRMAPLVPSLLPALPTGPTGPTGRRRPPSSAVLTAHSMTCPLRARCRGPARRCRRPARQCHWGRVRAPFGVSSPCSGPPPAACRAWRTGDTRQRAGRWKGGRGDAGAGRHCTTNLCAPFPAR